ncbi:hypothetical protein HDU81_001531, partial [Chytriomyces hyalinus]
LPLYHVKSEHHTLYSDTPGLLFCQGTINDHPVSILIDSGANPSFIHSSLLFLQDKPLIPQACKIKLADGSIVKGQRTEPLELKINNTTFTDTCSFTTVPELAYDLILGKDWLDAHNPSIGWLTNQVRIGPHSWKCRPPRSTPEILTTNQFLNLLETLQPDDFVGTIVPEEEESTATTSAEIDEKDEAVRKSLPPNGFTVVFNHLRKSAQFEIAGHSPKNFEELNKDHSSKKCRS